MRKLGLDVGDKTIGVAVSDALNMTAQGKTTIERVGIKKDTGKVLDFVREYEVDTIVIGLPLSMSGSDTEQTVKTREFAEKLANKLKSNSLDKVAIEFQDERLTSVMADRAMLEGDLSREKRKDIIDRQAAVIILQSWLDRVQ